MRGVLKFSYAAKLHCLEHPSFQSILFPVLKVGCGKSGFIFFLKKRTSLPIWTWFMNMNMNIYTGLFCILVAGPNLSKLLSNLDNSGCQEHPAGHYIDSYHNHRSPNSRLPPLLLPSWLRMSLWCYPQGCPRAEVYNTDYSQCHFNMCILT